MKKPVVGETFFILMNNGNGPFVASAAFQRMDLFTGGAVFRYTDKHGEEHYTIRRKGYYWSYREDADAALGRLWARWEAEEGEQVAL